MKTSSELTSKAEVMHKLHKIIDYHLYESECWPADEEAVSAFWRILERLGLTEGLPQGAIRYTVLGIECEAPMASYLIGAHEPMEVPMMLEKHGLINEQEADDFYASMEVDSSDILHEVEAMVRRAFSTLCGFKNEHVQA